MQSVSTRKINRIAYLLGQLVWGLPQTFLGFLVFLLCAGCPHERFCNAVLTRWKAKSSLSLGLFLFVTDNPLYHYGGRRTKEAEEEMFRKIAVHEYGHTIQSLIWGPFYLLTVGLPSIVWAWFTPFVRRRARERISYYAVYPENQANRLGERFTGFRSPGEIV